MAALAGGGRDLRHFSSWPLTTALATRSQYSSALAVGAKIIHLPARQPCVLAMVLMCSGSIRPGLRSWSSSQSWSIEGREDWSKGGDEEEEDEEEDDDDDEDDEDAGDGADAEDDDGFDSA